MDSLFFRQFSALFWKNWIILSKHKLSNVLCCVLLPIGYGIFLAIAPNFLSQQNTYGVGTLAPIHELATQFDGSLALIWADGTNSTGSPSASAVMAQVTSRFDEFQLRAVKQVPSPSDIPSNCQQNFGPISDCYAAITFNYLPVSLDDGRPIDYTINVDASLTHVDVDGHTSDIETRVLPLQLAIDKAFIALRTGESIPTPLEWPYARGSNLQQSTDMRLFYVKAINSPLVIAFFACYIGIVYRLVGALSKERANLVTSHMKAMGLLDSARIISWHLSTSVVYLPAWIVVALTWHYKIFTETNAGIVLLVHLLLGLSLASWSFFVAIPFGKNSQLAVVMSVSLSILATLVSVFSRVSTGVAIVFTLISPPGYYVFAIRAISGYENHLMPTNLLKPDPDSHVILFPIMFACAINIFLWPYLGALLERRLYDAREPSSGFFGRKREDLPPHPNGVAISIRNLRKTLAPTVFSRGKRVTTVSDLSLNIPKSGIFILLGSSCAGKSTLLSIISNLVGHSSGSVSFEGGVKRPPRGTLGIVPQKNVLFPDLTCYQTLRVWHAIKHSLDSAREDEDCEQLLRDCSLGKQAHLNVDKLSWAEKRKLQLAVGLVGGSKIVLVDECMSGVDPLSRHAIWKALASVKNDRTIVLATNFFDEADFLADHIAILTAPGKLVAEGSPSALKMNLGQGYSIGVTFDFKESDKQGNSSAEVLHRVREFAPQSSLSQPSPTHAAFHLKSKDLAVVERVLQLLDDEAETHHIASVEVLGTSIEDIFLSLTKSEDRARMPDNDDKPMKSTEIMSTLSTPDPSRVPPASSRLMLVDGQARSPLSQALTICYKRMLIARRSWLTPLFTVFTAVCGAGIPLLFLSIQAPSCMSRFNETLAPLYLPESLLGISGFPSNASILQSPPNITETMGQSAALIPTENVPDNATFISVIQQDYLDIPIGGISIDMRTGDALVAWDVTPLRSLTGPMLLNLATNILYNRALNASGDTTGTPSIIMANYASFPQRFADLKWIVFFGAAMAVYPAFFSLYVSRERRSSIQAMQFANGLSGPIGLWLGHLLWDSILSLIVATVTVIIFASASNTSDRLGFFWIVLVLYGIVGALLSYCVSLFMSSPLISFIVVAGCQIAMFALYLTSYLFILTYAKTSQAGQIIVMMRFMLPILSPVASVAESAFALVNLFSPPCVGSVPVTTPSPGDIMQFTGPILYLFINGFVLLSVIVLAESGPIISRCLWRKRKHRQNLATSESSRQDVAREAKAAAYASDALRVLHVTKLVQGKKVVDDISFGVSEETTFALLGPKEAGKTMMFDIIRGSVVSEAGDVKIRGLSVFDSPGTARLALGVCPQFDAIDNHLTVREHLMIYGRLKGVVPGAKLDANIESLMLATSLHTCANRLVSQLPSCDRRKLSLAIALMGNPSVLLVDEYTAGMDFKTKRDLWATLKNVVAGRATVINTHSAREASALANKVGIMSKEMLAIGTTKELATRYNTYQVQFACSTREDIMRAQVLMSRIPGARLVDDVATRFKVSVREVGSGNKDAHEDGKEDCRLSLVQLFHALASQGDFSEFTIKRMGLEEVFVEVMRQDDRLGEDGELGQRRPRFWHAAYDWGWIFLNGVAMAAVPGGPLAWV